MIKDSGQRKEFTNGFVRDLDTDKLRFDLIPVGQLKSLARQYTDGMQKYGENNRQLARSKVAIERFKQSAWRHFISRQNGEYDENHNDATIFNIMAYEYHRNRMNYAGLLFDDEGNESDKFKFNWVTQEDGTKTTEYKGIKITKYKGVEEKELSRLSSAKHDEIDKRVSAMPPELELILSDGTKIDKKIGIDYNTAYIG